MPTLRLVVPSAPRVTVIDCVLGLWAIAWIILAIAVAHNTREVANVGDTVSKTGTAVEQVGSALGSLPSIPLVPSDVHDSASSISAAGSSAVVNGRDGADATRRLATLLGISIALLPSIPILGLYLPVRIWRLREAQRVRIALRSHADDESFKEYLANRAVANLPFEKLRELSPKPWADLREGRFDRLAEAEVERLGLADDRRI
jgi:hypothetical protein